MFKIPLRWTSYSNKFNIFNNGIWFFVKLTELVFEGSSWLQNYFSLLQLLSTIFCLYHPYKLTSIMFISRSLILKTTKCLVVNAVIFHHQSIVSNKICRKKNPFLNPRVAFQLNFHLQKSWRIFPHEKNKENFAFSLKLL